MGAFARFRRFVVLPAADMAALGFHRVLIGGIGPISGKARPARNPGNLLRRKI
jgi:hypothetical protein